MHEANQIYVSALSRGAENMGLMPGTSLTDVRAASPDIHYFDADPWRDEKCMQGLLRWAGRFTPRLARGGGQDLFLDITGTSHLFGGEDALLETIQSKLSRLGFTARLGLAGTKAAAWGFSHYGSDKSNISSEDLRTAVQTLPVEALKMGHGPTILCKQLGLKTIGALLALPQRTLASRIGLEGIKRIRQLLGEEAEVTRFARHRQRLIEVMQFPDPIGHSSGVEMALERLLTRLCQRLLSLHRGIRKASLILEKVDHETLSFSINTARPNCDVEALKRLFSHHFEQLDVGFGIERMLLHARHTGPLNNRQMDMDDACKDSGQDALDGLINTLSNMFGYERVQRFTPAHSHIPERGFSREYALYPTQDPRLGQSWIMPLCKRPLLLFKKPVGVWREQSTNSSVPQTIIWKNEKCIITPLSGPERIEPDWWYDNPQWRSGPRDYWWVQTRCGTLLWIFCVADKTCTQWYVHGLGS